MQHVNKKCFFVLELTEMIIMDKINDSEIKNAPPQNGNIANSNKLQNIREIHPIIKNVIKTAFLKSSFANITIATKAGIVNNG